MHENQCGRRMTQCKFDHFPWVNCTGRQCALEGVSNRQNFVLTVQQDNLENLMIKVTHSWYSSLKTSSEHVR